MSDQDQRLFVEFDRQYFGEQVMQSNVRPATETEVETAKTHFTATGKCDHSVIVDTPGYMYDVRSCFICNKGLGLI